MTQFLPPNLLALFAPRDPIPFLPQLVKLPHEKHHNQPYSGIAPFIRHFEVNMSYIVSDVSWIMYSLFLADIFFIFLVTRIPEMPLHQQGQRLARRG